MSDSVALRTNANIPEAGGGTTSPLGTQSPFQAMDTMQQIRARQSQVQNLQQQFSARQRAGQIISAAPDFETGLTAIQKDPLVAGFAPDIIASLRGTQAIMTEMQGKQLGQNRDAVQMVLRGAAGAMNDPGSLKGLVQAGMQNLPPEVRQRIGPAVQSYVTSLTSGLGPQDGQKYQQRFQGMLQGSGMDTPSVTSLMGEPTTVEQGNVISSALKRPGIGVVPAGPRYEVGAAPRLEMVPQGNQTTPFLLSGQGSGPVGAPLTMGPAPRLELAPQGDKLTPYGLSAQGSGPVAPSLTVNPTPRLEMVPQGNQTTPYSLSSQGSGPVGQPLPQGLAPAYHETPVPGMPGATQPSIVGQGGINPLGVVGGNSLVGAGPDVRLGTGGPLGTGAPTGPAPRTATPGEIESQRKTVEVQAETRKQISEEFRMASDHIPVMAKNVDEMQRSLTQFQAGGGAGVRLELGRLAQAVKNMGIDIPQKTIDKIGNDNLAATQYFMANVKPAMVRALKEDAQGTGRVMLPEVKAYIEAMDATNDPRFLMENLNKAKWAIQVSQDKAAFWPTYRKMVEDKDPSIGNAGIEDYHTWYNLNRREKDMYSGTPGGIVPNLTPMDPQAARGATPSPTVGSNPRDAVRLDPNPQRRQEQYDALKPGDSYVVVGPKGELITKRKGGK